MFSSIIMPWKRSLSFLRKVLYDTQVMCTYGVIAAYIKEKQLIQNPESMRFFFPYIQIGDLMNTNIIEIIINLPWIPFLK